VAAAGADGAHGRGEGAPGAEEDDELLGSGDGGVEQLKLQPGGEASYDRAGGC
jgi:hypothetical protein